MEEKLTIDFYLQDTQKVARSLLGQLFVCKRSNVCLIGKIVETEAYLGSEDEASHSFNGKTNRNSAMFETGGILYVYKSYGIHHCVNVVTENEGLGSAVLIRAVEPLMGLSLMTRNRKLTDIRRLCNGPGNLCKAFGLTLDQNYRSLIGN